MTTTLHTRAIDGGPFNCLPARDIDLNPERILCNNIILPGEFNPHNVRLWIIGNEFGALGAVWADCEQDAFDELVDAGLGSALLIDESYAEELGEGCSHLGNAGEPADLANAWIQEVQFNPARDWKLLCAFAEARGSQQTTLDN